MSHKVCAGPPEISIFCSFPPASNTTYRLSGDQKGGGKMAAVDSESGRGCASSEFRERIHTLKTPSEPVAGKANWRPSGDTAKGSPVGKRPVGEIWKRIASAGRAGTFATRR